jgi:hypothetical protein
MENIPSNPDHQINLAIKTVISSCDEVFSSFKGRGQTLKESLVLVLWGNFVADFQLLYLSPLIIELI